MINIIKFLFFAFCILYLWSSWISRKYSTPFKVYVIFGKKGVGKSADIVKRALKYQKKGYRTFCSESDVKVCEFFKPEDFGKWSCKKSVIFLDEAGTVFHKRDFTDKSKYFDLKAARNFVKWSRHEEMIVYIYSQSWDIDMSLKEGADALYLYKKFFNVFTIGKRIDKSIVMTTPQADRPGAMMDSFSFEPFWMPGSRVINYIPRYAKYYDSYKKSGIPSYEEFYGLPVVRDAGSEDGAPDATGAGEAAS